ncbi:complement C1q-like protein 4 [Mercenaria mercenaria]|uniref:complement C1q-like protein 4 n=1 Tax=Mercenaria mercenaria TaxID=6596 RepID=UPI00234F4735|nr:complement C1q-like protein 4 [Mercenaria mercenaria]
MFHFSGLTFILTYFCITTSIFGSLEDEPQCVSRFDYEFKVVQKLADLENKPKEQQQTTESLQHKCTGNAVSENQVAFSAYLTGDMTSVPNHRIIIFNEVQTNVGDAYNGKTGIFVCRIPGVYVFYWVTTNKDHTYMDSELVVNGEERSQAFSDSGNHNDYSVASNVVTTELKFGDQVWIRSGTWHNGKIGGERRTSFSGFMLYMR